MKSFPQLTGLVAAAHTPFTQDTSLHLAGVEKQAAHFLKNKIHLAFIGGSTGESHSLTTDERRQLAQRWLEVARGTPLQVIVHVGSNCLTDAAALARQLFQWAKRDPKLKIIPAVERELVEGGFVLRYRTLEISIHPSKLKTSVTKQKKRNSPPDWGMGIAIQQNNSERCTLR